MDEGDGRFGLIIVGYVIMRVGLVLQWLRAARNDPARRRTCLRYALGIVVVQLGWVAFYPAVARPGARRCRSSRSWSSASSCVPVWAERDRARRPGTRTTSPSGTACSSSSCSARRSCPRRWPCRRRSRGRPSTGVAVAAVTAGRGADRLQPVVALLLPRRRRGAGTGAARRHPGVVPLRLRPLRHLRRRGRGGRRAGGPDRARRPPRGRAPRPRDLGRGDGAGRGAARWRCGRCTCACTTRRGGRRCPSSARPRSSWRARRCRSPSSLAGAVLAVLVVVETRLAAPPRLASTSSAVVAG